MMSSNLAVRLCWQSDSLTVKTERFQSMNNLEQTNNTALFTVDEAAERLRVSRWMIYRMMRSNELKSVTIASRRLVASDDLIEFINKHKGGFYEQT